MVTEWTYGAVSYVFSSGSLLRVLFLEGVFYRLKTNKTYPRPLGMKRRGPILMATGRTIRNFH